MTELAVSGIPVTVTCRVLKLARQPYYRWLVRRITDSEVVEAHRANALFDAHHDDPEFGHRLLADEARYAGQVMADRTAWRICRDNAWWSFFGKKRGGKGKKPGPAVHDDLCTVTDEKGRIRHEFTAAAPNELWLTDITEHKTSEGRLYLCAVKDGFSKALMARPAGRESATTTTHLRRAERVDESMSISDGENPIETGTGWFIGLQW